MNYLLSNVRVLGIMSFCSAESAAPCEAEVTNMPEFGFTFCDRNEQN
jgi:hypothetical protein